MMQQGLVSQLCTININRDKDDIYYLEDIIDISLHWYQDKMRLVEIRYKIRFFLAQSY